LTDSICSDLPKTNFTVHFPSSKPLARYSEQKRTTSGFVNSARPEAEISCPAALFISHTISEDRTGNNDMVCMKLLSRGQKLGVSSLDTRAMGQEPISFRPLGRRPSPAHVASVDWSSAQRIAVFPENGASMSIEGLEATRLQKRSDYPVISSVHSGGQSTPMADVDWAEWDKIFPLHPKTSPLPQL
jgi:hypothetical protein